MANQEEISQKGEKAAAAQGDAKPAGEAKLTGPDAGRKIWDFLNSQFALWFLSSVVLGLITFFWNSWNDERLEKQKAEQTAQERQREDSQFLATLLPYLTNSDVTVRLRAEDVILARYPQDKVPPQIQVLIANSVFRETSAPDAHQTDESKRLLASVNSTFTRVQTFAANNQIESLLAAAQAANKRQQVTVTYYPKSADTQEFEKYSSDEHPDFENYLQSELARAGFRFQQLPPARNQDLASNAIWVSDDVSLDQAKFVALVLMQGGFQLRALRRFRSDSAGAPRKTGNIEIGSDAAFLNVPPLTATSQRSYRYPQTLVSSWSLHRIKGVSDRPQRVPSHTGACIASAACR